VNDPFGDLNPPYRTIVADPPWRYRSAHVTSRTSHDTPAAENHYSTMTNSEIAALPVADLADKDAHLYMWVTNPKLYGDRKRGEPSPVEIMEAWGFRYVTLLTWIKKPGALGMGFYFRGETEHVLFGVRGNLGIPTERRQVNWFMAGKSAHSVKPAKFFEVVHAVSPGPYLELFAREPRLGWDSWGKGFETEEEVA
jgi:N6-adenosine-specific RNA methylase IME4